MKLKFMLIIFLVLIFREALSQPNEEWVQRYNGTASSYDLASRMLIDKDNNVLVFRRSNETGFCTGFFNNQIQS